MNEYYSDLNIQYRAELTDQLVSAEELTLIESVMPDLIVAMMHDQVDVND